MRIELIATLDDIRGDAHHLARMSRLMREHQGYRHLTDAQGRAFGTYEAFCVASRPFGLGYEPRDIEAIIAERKSAQAHAQHALPLAAHGEIGGGHSRDNVVMSGRQGNASDYLTRRIARDRPDILERMRAGEFKSVRAAAREAGLVRPEIHLPLDPRRAAALLCKHFDAGQREELIALLLSARAIEDQGGEGQGGGDGPD